MKQYKGLVWIAILVASCFGQIGDPDYLDVQSLIQYAKTEHNVIGQMVNTKNEIFHWEFMPFAKFPMLEGRQCPYFDGAENYKNVEGLGNVVYKAGENLYYVGTFYYYTGKDTSKIDTCFYKVVAYQGIETGWKRCYDVMTLKSYHDRVLQEIGRVNYK